MSTASNPAPLPHGLLSTLQVGMFQRRHITQNITDEHRTHCLLEFLITMSLKVVNEADTFLDLVTISTCQ
jgi:hypothetical protein